MLGVGFQVRPVPKQLSVEIRHGEAIEPYLWDFQERIHSAHQCVRTRS